MILRKNFCEKEVANWLCFGVCLLFSCVFGLLST